MDEKLDADAVALLSALEAGELAADERARAEALLARSAEARATLARLERLRRLTAELPEPALPGAARRRVGDRAVAALESAVHSARRRRVGLALVAGAVAAALIALLIGRPWRARVVPSMAEGEIRTGPGEHRLLELGGRATAFVGERSLIRVAPGRPIRVESGRVRLVVRPDPTTPFVVATAAADATVRGTEFDVDVSEEGTEVRVARGEVEVRNPRGARTLWAGEVARARVGAAPRRVERIEPVLLDGPAEIEQPPAKRRRP